MATSFADTPPGAVGAEVETSQPGARPAAIGPGQGRGPGPGGPAVRAAPDAPLAVRGGRFLFSCAALGPGCLVSRRATGQPRQGCDRGGGVSPPGPRQPGAAQAQGPSCQPPRSFLSPPRSCPVPRTCRPVLPIDPSPCPRLDSAPRLDCPPCLDRPPCLHCPLCWSPQPRGQLSTQPRNHTL